MKWIAISGSWRNTTQKLEKDLKREVGLIFKQGNGLISGGALGVDQMALGEFLKLDSSGKRVKIFLPASLEVFALHFRKRAQEGAITGQQAEGLIEQLSNLKKVNRESLVESNKNKIIDNWAYFERNTRIIEAADELIAFWVNKSKGTQDTIRKAEKKGIGVKIYEYEVEF